MATRSAIGYFKNGKVYSVYCHWDGYPENNGRILLDNYNTFKKVKELISFGSISSLGIEIGEKHPFDRYNYSRDSNMTAEQIRKLENMTTFYGRDREEKNVDAREFEDYLSYYKYYYDCGVEFFYVFTDGEWYYMPIQPLFDFSSNPPISGWTKLDSYFMKKAA
jgi:hypothetical protein